VDDRRKECAGSVMLQSMNDRLRALAASRGGVFTRGDALASGSTVDAIRHALKSGRWQALQHGVYVETDLFERTVGAARHALLLAALMARLQRYAVASHESALFLRDLPLYRQPTRLSLTSASGTYRASDEFRICVAALPRPHLAPKKTLGVPSCTTSRALVDLARAGDFRAALIPLEAALHRGLVDRDGLAAILTDCADWAGAAIAKNAVDFAEPKSESPAETLSRCVFREQDIEIPTSQVWIAIDSDVPEYRVDFYWERWRVIGEVDGKVKYVNDPDQRWEEKRREERLVDADYEVVRWSYLDAKHRGPMLKAKILRAFARAARRFGLSG
jgi:hypothetical protein